MLDEPLLFTGSSSIQFFNSPPFPNTVSQDTFGNLPLSVQYLFDLPCHVIGDQVLLTQPLLREAENFLRGGMYLKDLPLPTYLAWLQPA